MSYWFYFRSMTNDVNNVKGHLAKTKRKKSQLLKTKALTLVVIERK